MKRVRLFNYAQHLFVCLSLGATCAHAILGQPGTLDPTWNGAAPGKAITSFGSFDDTATATAIQPDRKVVVAGVCYQSASVAVFCVARYNENGSLDTGFGSGGKASTAVAGDGYVRAVVIQGDGKIVLAGTCTVLYALDFCMVRYHPDGAALDNSFNGNGKVTTRMSADDDGAFAIAVQPDGKIVVAGTCYSSSGTGIFCVARYDADGSLDAGFGSNGRVSTGLGTTATAFAIAVQLNGKIVVAGSCRNSGKDDFCVVRYNADGDLDTSFDGNGLLATDLSGGNDTARAVAIQPNGKIVVAGHCDPPAGTSNFCAARYDIDGALDTSFSGNGLVATSLPGGGSYATGLAIQSDGKIIIGGECDAGFCAVRYNSDGSLDNTFANSGKVSTTVVGLGYETARAMALQSDGKILLAGGCANVSGNSDFCVIRYDGGPFGAQNCKLDIDGDGKVLAATDMLIATRVALGMNGSSVTSGVAFAANATRTTWSSIRSYLVTQCGMSLP